MIKPFFPNSLNICICTWFILFCQITADDTCISCLCHPDYKTTAKKTECGRIIKQFLPKPNAADENPVYNEIRKKN